MVPAKCASRHVHSHGKCPGIWTGTFGVVSMSTCNRCPVLYCIVLNCIVYRWKTITSVWTTFRRGMMGSSMNWGSTAVTPRRLQVRSEMLVERTEVNCEHCIQFIVHNSYIKLFIDFLRSWPHITMPDVDFTLFDTTISSSSSSIICQTTGPKPLPKWFLHIEWSRASSFNWLQVIN